MLKQIMFYFYKILSVALILQFASISDAQLVSRDLHEVGDGLLTYDEANQREWLDLPYTGKYTNEEDFLSALSPGGEFEGFQFASEEDLLGLFRLDEIQRSDRFFMNANLNRVANGLIDLFDWTYEARGSIVGTWTVASGLVETHFGDLSIGNHLFDGTTISVQTTGTELVPGTLNRPINGRQLPNNVFVLDAPILFNIPVITFWMYRDVEILAVPEPSTLGLLLFGLAAYSRRRPS